MSSIRGDRIIERELALIQEEIPALDGFQRVLRCLHDHCFEEECNVNAIIEWSGVSKASIYARFKYYVGVGIHEYLEERRIQAAMRLLQHDELKIYVIAFSVGYQSPSVFNRAFRRHVGCNPTIYRKKMSIENVNRNHRGSSILFSIVAQGRNMGRD